MTATVTALLISLLLLGFSTAEAENEIYSWTDPQGVLHFSDQPPPEGAKNVQTSSEPQGSLPAGSEPEKREAYERMMEQVKAESLQSDADRSRKEAELKAEAQRRQQEEQQARIEAEQQRLNSEIEKIQARAVSPTFSQGMKQAQIEKIKKQLSELEAQSPLK